MISQGRGIDTWVILWGSTRVFQARIQKHLSFRVEFKNVFDVFLATLSDVFHDEELEWFKFKILRYQKSAWYDLYNTRLKFSSLKGFLNN